MTRTGSGSMNGVEDEPCLQTFPAQWPPRQWPPVLASSMPTGLSSLQTAIRSTGAPRSHVAFGAAIADELMKAG